LAKRQDKAAAQYCADSRFICWQQAGSASTITESGDAASNGSKRGISMKAADVRLIS
jgi:hypothetical protein